MAKIVNEISSFSLANKDDWMNARQKENNRLKKISTDWIRKSGKAQEFPGLLACGTGYNSAKAPTISHYVSGKSGMKNMYRCHSSWGCPECSSKNMWEASKRIGDLLQYIANENREYNDRYSAIMMTLTVPHHSGTPLKYFMQSFSNGFAHLMDSGDIRKIKKQFNYRCSVRCFDINVEYANRKTDWHPHIHALLIFNNDKNIIGNYKDGHFSNNATSAFKELSNTFKNQWIEKTAVKCFDNLYAKCSNTAFGFETINLDNIARYGNDDNDIDFARIVGSYLSGSSKLLSDGTNANKYQIFDLLARNDNREDFRRKCWIEYLEATKGFNRVIFSKNWLKNIPGYEEITWKSDKSNWTFQPSKRLLRLLNRKQNIKRNVLKLAGDNKPIEMISLINDTIDNENNEDNENGIADTIIGSIIDYGGLSDDDKAAIEKMSCICFIPHINK